MTRNLAAVIFLVSLLAGSASKSQTPVANDNKEVLALVKEVQAQQVQITENQAKIDAKLAEIAETLRIARIFTSREK
jgi:outer membrane lipoprotein-sorting protein